MKASEQYGYLDIQTDSTDNDAFTLFTEPLAKIVANSGKRVWLEARLEIGDADANQGFFFGLGEEACQSLELIVDDNANLITETLVGYRIFSPADTSEAAIDLVAQKDAGAESVILSDVTDADSLGTAGAALADNTEYKLGIVFDGSTTMKFYVNGTLVAKDTVDTTYYDATKALCVLASLKTAAAQSIAVDWVAYACEI